MKASKIIAILILALVTIIGCQNAQKQSADFNQLQRALVSPDSSLLITETAVPIVYYFHNTRRCLTCNTVEAVTIEALKEYYGDKITFISLNIEENENKALIENLKITGQTLLVKYGEKQIDLTNEAFMNARNSPEKLKLKIKEIIDPLL